MFEIFGFEICGNGLGLIGALTDKIDFLGFIKGGSW